MALSSISRPNTVFKPLRHGTEGVIDGDYQYVVYVKTQTGELRPLDQAQYLES